MATYAFLAQRPNGAPLTMEVVDLDDEGRLPALATAMLDQHPSAAEVAVWCGDDCVFTQKRIGGPATLPDNRAAGLLHPLNVEEGQIMLSPRRFGQPFPR